MVRRERPSGSDRDEVDERWKHVLLMLEHEMRTPLAAALMQLNVVEQAMTKATSLGRAKTMLSGAKRQLAGLSTVMRRTVEIQTRGRVALHPEPCNLGGVAADLLDRLTVTSPVLWSRVKARMAGDLEGRWDRSALEQIFENLLSNALKFSREPVLLKVTTARGGARIIVQDRGGGIDLPDQQRVFELFARGSGAHGVAGHGIGLWMVRKLVDAHGGRIRLKSRPGIGSIFEVWLPRCSENDDGDGAQPRTRKSRPALQSA
jgi:signal transduction histidine kinase